MKEEYGKYLVSLIEGIEISDKEGKLLISKDLKVTHIPSGFEYTVDGILQDDSQGVRIILRTPDSPRQAIEKRSGTNDSIKKVSVSQKEFEKNYRES